MGQEESCAGGAARITVPAKVRFEVFKRDKFTCQYCGEFAPNVVLNCDHIDPVANGGGNEVINLITSCKKCNGGKGAIPLSDHGSIDLQQAALAELEERRQQLDMMLWWRDELRSLSKSHLDIVIEAMSRGGFQPNDRQREMVSKWLRNYTLAELLPAIDEAFDIYLVDGEMESWKTAFSKVRRFIEMARQEKERPYIKRVLYIQGILRNRTGCSGTADFIEALHLAGTSLDFLESEAKRTNYITHFTRPGMALLEENGTPWTRGRPWT